MAEKSNNMKQKAETCQSKHRWKKKKYLIEKGKIEQ